MVDCITPFSSGSLLLDHQSSSRGLHQAAGRDVGGFEGRKVGTVALRQCRVGGRFDGDCMEEEEEGEGEEGREALGRWKEERGLGR